MPALQCCHEKILVHLQCVLFLINRDHMLDIAQYFMCNKNMLEDKCVRINEIIILQLRTTAVHYYKSVQVGACGKLQNLAPPDCQPEKSSMW